MDFFNVHKKKIVVTLFSVLALGSVAYAVNQSQTEPDSLKQQTTAKKDKRGQSSKKGVIERATEDENETLFPNLSAEETSPDDVITQASGSEKATLSPKSYSNDLSRFDKRAKASDKKQQAAGDSILTRATPAQTMSAKKNKGTTEKTTKPSVGPSNPNSNGQTNRPETPSNPTPVTPVQPNKPNPTPPVTPTPPKATDYHLLEAIVSQVKELSKDDYLSVNFAILEKELGFAERILADRNATQAQVNNQVAGLQRAKANLILKGDKTQLNDLLTQVSAIDRAIYTPESLDVLDEAVNSIQPTVADAEVSQDQVNEAKDHVQTAFDGLVKIDEPDLTLVFLNRLIAECDALTLTDYTPDSVAIFQPVLDHSKTFVTQAGITEETAKQQLEALQTAIDQLVKRADKSSLQTLVNEVKGLSESDYTTSSWATVTSALTQAEALLTNENATQIQIDSAKTTLNQVKNKLEKKETA